MLMDSLLELRKFLTPEFIYGLGSRLLVGRYSKNLGARKVLIVTDDGIIKAGWVADIITSLEEYNIDYTIYSDVTANPRSQEVTKGADLYNKEDCNAIVAVGGGSPMDCAKAIGIISSGDSNIKNFEGVDKIDVPIPPLICIPTTAGSAADVSQFAIIKDETRNLKMTIASRAIVPDIALIDPMVLTTKPPYLIACTGMDALTHAIEAYVSNANSVFSDLFALEAVKVISSNLLQIIKDPSNLQVCGNAMLGSLYAGIAFSNASLGAVHAMSHSLGGLLDKPHGECNALLLEHVIKYNFKYAPLRYKLIGEAMGLDFSNMDNERILAALIKYIKDLKLKVGINRTLKDIGLENTMIPLLAKYSINDACMATNPVLPRMKDIEVIYENAF